MIERFKHKGLRKLYEKGDRSGLRTDIAMKAELVPFDFGYSPYHERVGYYRL